MPPKLTYAQVKDYFDSIDCKLVSTTYETNKQPLQYLCCCGNPTIETARLDSIRRGIRCPKCRLDRLKKTNKERFGYEFVSQRPEKKESALKGIRKHIAEKKHTLEELKTYYKEKGCELLETEYKSVVTPMRFKCVCGKIATNKFEKFRMGRRCNFKTCVDKRKEETNMAKFGSTSYAKTEECKEKRKATCLEKYGVEYAAQSPIVQAKIEKSALTFKPYTLPSGIIVNIQGYENLALDLLLKTHAEEEIKIGRTEQPEIWWIDDEGAPHRYFSDLYIPSTKTVIEVKSTWTYEKGKEKLDILKPTAEELGYTYRIYVFNDRGKLEFEL